MAAAVAVACSTYERRAAGNANDESMMEKERERERERGKKESGD